jgi:hypothetical protein
MKPMDSLYRLMKPYVLSRTSGVRGSATGTDKTPRCATRTASSASLKVMALFGVVAAQLFIGPQLAAQFIVPNPVNDATGASTGSSEVPAAQVLNAPPAVQFSVDDAIVASTDSLELSVRCGNNFTEVTSFQFSLSWDPAIVQFNSVGSFGMGAGLAMFNVLPATTAQGKLGLVWTPASAGPETYASGTTIFKLNLTALGSAGTGSLFQFVDNPSLREVSVNFAAVGFDGRAGNVSIVPEPTKTALVFAGAMAGWGIVRSVRLRLIRKNA